ncbi:hypothetical protein [Actinacidiphila sp. bgisy160]|uniref:hypothetical protein n=1 Tax=Actinacidiphila sp. bgisy160 TaxID=3413796 RepID=UPI003D726C8A
MARQPEADPDKVAEEVEFLMTADRDTFAAELIEHVALRNRQRDAARTEAFRHPDIVARTEQEADRLLRNHGPLVDMEDGETRKAYRRRTDGIRRNLEFELRLATLIVDGDRARQGRITTDRNPVRRALLRLAAENPQRFIALKREERHAAGLQPDE